MYEDAFNACYYDNPGVCTAFVSWGFTDKFSSKAEDLKPLYFTEDYEMKPAYTAVLNAISSDLDILPDYLAFSRATTNLEGRDLCTGCEGDVGECRLSWPLGDELRARSELAAWRCKPTMTYGGECKGNYEFCEDWCTTAPDGENACRWSWPT